MSDVQLSVEVLAKMQALSNGLKKGKEEIADFVNTSIPGLENLQRVLNSLGVNTSAQGLRNLSSAARDLAVSSNESTNALINQRTATEAQRTAAAASRAELAALRTANAANRAATVAASGSYQEAQQRLRQLGIQIRSVNDGFRSQSPLMQARIAEYNRLNQSLKDFDARMGNHQRNVGNYSGALQNAGAGLLSMVSGYMSLGSALSYVFDQTLKFDRIKTPLAFVLGSDGDANMKLKELKTLANDLGLEYFTLAASYKQFTAAAMASNFPLKESEKIFTSVSKAAAVLKLSDEQLKGSLLALQQMISKGNVQAEELRGQLAERLPGAFSLAAKAMGVTDTELNKLLKNGEVLASDLLPKLALELDKRYGDKAADGIKGLSAELGRLQTAMQSLGGEGSALSENVFEPVIRGARMLAQELSNTFKGSAWENLQRFMTFSTAGRENIDRSYNTREQFKNSKSSLSGSMDRQYTGMPLGELRNYYDQIQKSAIAAENNYRQFQTGIKAGKLKEEFDGQLQSFKELSQNLLAERKMIGAEIDRQKQRAKNNKSEIADLNSIKAIRAEITRLSSLPGSSTKGSDVSNKILALKAQLKELSPSTAKPSTRVFDTVEKQLSEFHNKANIITKEGLAKDLQEWDDKYNKIKAAIEKMPAGAAKTKASDTLETEYKDGRANIIEASTKKIQEAIRKRNEAINAADLEGIAKEIDAVNSSYDEQVRLAEGNKEGVILLRKQQADEVSKIERDHAAADANTITNQIAEIATAYRNRQADIYVSSKTGSPFAQEIADNEEAKEALKLIYSGRIGDYEEFQNRMNALISDGNALKATQDMVQAMVALVSTFSSEVVGKFAEGVGEMLVTGDAAEFGKGLITAFAGFLGKIGDLLLQYGIAAKAKALLDMSLAIPGAALISGGAAIAAGIALKIAAGAIASAASSSSTSGGKQLPKFAMGGNNLAGGPAIVGERGPEIINIPTGSHVIPNHKVLESINNGGGGPTFIISSKIHMGELVTAIEKQQRSNNRIS